MLDSAHAAASPASRPSADGSVTVSFHEPARRLLLDGRRGLLASLVIAVVVLGLIALAGSLAAPGASEADFASKNLAPSLAHPFGTDWMGRDMFERTLAGLSTSIWVGLLSACLSSIIALALACASALGGPRADAAVTWIIDVVMGVPHLVLLILVSYALGRGAMGVMVGVACTHWTSLARVLRAEIMQVGQRPYIACARQLGASPYQVALRHILPAVASQYLVGLILLFPHAILHEASITFLGFGLSPETAAIGVILSEAMAHLSAGSWWLAVFPGASLVLVVLLFDRIGAGLRRLTSREGVQS